MKKVCVFLADGFEEIEGLTVVDVLRRAQVEVSTVSIMDTLDIHGAHGINIKADQMFDEADFSVADMLVLPGGMPGTLNLENCGAVQSAIDNAVNTNCLLCAICAAPSILGHKDLLNGKKAICFPGFEDALSGAELSKEYVVRDGNYITARGAGVCIDFGLEIVKAIKGDDEANRVKESIQCR